MNKRFLGAAVLALAAPVAFAQAPASAAGLAGRWLYDDHGKTVGSIRSISPDGRTATVMLGVPLVDAVRVVTVPVGALFVSDNKATLRRDTAEALNAFSPR